jgi:hypothetical protein
MAFPALRIDLHHGACTDSAIFVLTVVCAMQHLILGLQPCLWPMFIRYQPSWWGKVLGTVQRPGSQSVSVHSMKSCTDMQALGPYVTAVSHSLTCKL